MEDFFTGFEEVDRSIIIREISEECKKIGLFAFHHCENKPHKKHRLLKETIDKIESKARDIFDFDFVKKIDPNISLIYEMYEESAEWYMLNEEIEGYASERIASKVQINIQKSSIDDDAPRDFKYFLINCDDTQKNKIIADIKSIINPKTTPKSIAMILLALTEMNFITLDSVPVISNAWAISFGYRSTTKALRNGLSSYIAGDTTKFRNENRSKIDVYKNSLGLISG